MTADIRKDQFSRLSSFSEDDDKGGERPSGRLPYFINSGSPIRYQRM